MSYFLNPKIGKITCPSCGQKKKFVQYTDEQGNPLADVDGNPAGQCDRTNSCGHSVKPHFEGKGVQKVVVPMPDIIYLDLDEERIKTLRECLNNTTSNFHQYCKKLQIPFSHLQKWGIGTDKDKTSFVFLDKTGKPVNVKFIKYLSNGHRDKTWENIWTLKGKTDAETKQEYRYKICLFGEHIKRIDNNRWLGIVESEKTAVIASFFYPQFDWVACSAGDGLTDHKAAFLKRKQVFWCCDADEKGRNNSSMKTLIRNKIKHKIVDLFPERNDGYDLADAIDAGIRPNIQEVLDKAEFVGFGKKSESIFADLKVEKPLKVTSDNAETIFIKPTESTHKPEDSHSISYTENGISYFGGGKAGVKRVASGFQVLIRYQNKDENDEVYWLIQIVDVNIDVDKRKKPITIEMTNEQFNKAKFWKDEISKYALSFKIDDNILTELQEFLFLYRKFHKAVRVLRYGWHNESQTFLFSNKGIYQNQLKDPDENGMLRCGEVHISLPQLKSSNKSQFVYAANDVKFNAWYEVYQRAYPNHAFIVVNHYLMTLFLDIMKTMGLKNPILFVKGKANSGKTTMIEMLSYLYGFLQKKSSLKSEPTRRAIAKLLSQNNGGFWHGDEYKPGMSYTDTFVSAFDFEGYDASADDGASNLQTIDYPVTRGLILTTNYEPKEPPFISRLIYMIKDDITKTIGETKAFGELQEMNKKGLSCITVEMLQYRKIIIDSFKECFKELEKQIKEMVVVNFGLNDVETRNYSKTTQTLVVGYILAKNHLVDFGFESKDPKDILNQFAMRGADQLLVQYQIMQAKTALAKFFEFFQSLYDQKRVFSPAHFRIVDDMFTINLNSFYPIYQKEYMMIMKESIQDKEEIREDLKLFDKEYKEYSSMRFADEVKGDNKLVLTVKNCISVSYTKLKVQFGLDVYDGNSNSPF